MPTRPTASLRSRFKRFTLFQRIAIGNALVIVAGAVFGTLITVQISNRDETPWLIILFAGTGILLSLGINFLIVRAALRPFHILARRLKTGPSDLDPARLPDPDPDTAQLASTLSSLVTQLEVRNRELRALSERTIAAQEEERKAIARSLHDETGQSLSMLIITLDRMADRLPGEPSEIRKQLAATRKLAADALAELRRTLAGLRPAILDDLGLASAIRWYAHEHLEKTGVRAQVQVPDAPLNLPPAVTIALFRITQEAVNNILRHAGAKNANIRLNCADCLVSLDVEDDGVGFERGQADQLKQLGLLGMRERAELLGGGLVVDSAPGRGTRLHASIPLVDKE
jgi:signal transduction histidine kinase